MFSRDISLIMFKLSSNFQGEPKGKQKENGWRLFHAKDFQSLMYPCFTFCRILGIFSYKVNASIFEASKPRYIVSAVIICVSGIYILITLYDSTIFGKIDMRILPKNLADYCVLVFGGFIMIVTFILSGPRMRLLQIIMNFSSRLPPEFYQKLSRLIHTKDIIGFLYLAGLVLMCTIWFQINFLFQIYINLVIFQMDMLYMNCVCVLKACLKRINDNLAHMRELVANNEPRVVKLIYNEQRNPFLIMELTALKRQHLIISDIVQMLNMIFSLQLLASVVITFSDITIHLYYYILDWQYVVLTSTLIKILFHTYFFSRTAYNFIKIALVVWACETGKDQALQISTSVHDMINSTIDKQIKDELQLFSLQVLHCEITFSAKGLTINAKLLAAIVSSVVMYVLILFQFMRMSYSCERKPADNITEVI